MLDKEKILRTIDIHGFYQSFIPSLKINGKAETLSICPFHNDHAPSLSINLQKGLFKCHACGAGGDVFGFYQKLKNVDFPTALKEIAAMQGIADIKSKVVATFKYKDAEGKTLYIKERIEPGRDGRSKEFRFKHQEGNKWVCDRGSTPVLYNLEEVSKSREVFVVEGEGKADLLMSWGLVATCLDSGSNSPWRGEYFKSFEGKEKIVILPDNDEPGRSYALRIAQVLYGKVGSLKIVALPCLGVKEDVIDWARNEGNDKNRFLSIVNTTEEWTPSEDKTPHQFNNQELIERFGEPYYLNDHGTVTGINESFWAGLHNDKNKQLYEPDEKTFYRYFNNNGYYNPITENLLKQEIADLILEMSRARSLPSLERRKNNATLNHIVAHLKGIAERRGVFNRKQKIIHVANGMIVFNDSGDADLCEFSPEFYSRNQSPIPFNPDAKCERFLNELLLPAVSPNDAILIQKYFGMCLLGNNLIQRLLILDGLAGTGKTQLILVAQKLVGQSNVSELRTKQLSERFELFRYLKKTLLVGVDVPGNFLSEKGAHVIKGLVGGDYFDAEQKGGTGSFPLQGNFCILISCNSHLHVKLDGDVGAWRRRLLIVRYEAPPPTRKIPNFADLLIKEEGSGILNWALQGLAMLFDDLKQYGDIQLTSSQTGIVDSLLAESDSLRIFLRECIENKEHSDLSSPEIVEGYAQYCPVKKWNPKPITVIHKELEGLMLELFGSSRAHSIVRDGRSAKGFRRVKFRREGF